MTGLKDKDPIFPTIHQLVLVVVDQEVLLGDKEEMHVDAQHPVLLVEVAE